MTAGTQFRILFAACKITQRVPVPMDAAKCPTAWRGWERDKKEKAQQKPSERVIIMTAANPNLCARARVLMNKCMPRPRALAAIKS